MGKPDEESNVSLDMPLFYGKFPKFKSEQEVRGKVHLEDEKYFKGHKEIFPLTKEEEKRIYVSMVPYFNIPNIIVTASFNNQSAFNAGSIGKVVSSQTNGYNRHQIGMAQAWYYPENKIILLWECLLYSLYRIDDLGIDGNTLKLWTSFEKILINEFPLAKYMLTTHQDPAYKDEAYRSFLKSLGYKPMSEAQAVWGKALKNNTL
jgi:hypothetical protein